MFLRQFKQLPLSLIASALLAVAVTALETWLRIPIAILLEGYIQAVVARCSGLLRRMSIRTFIQEVLC